jgi:ribosomal protein L16 Arg81 hydroxylase
MIDKASRTPPRDLYLGSPLEERLVNSLIVRNLFYLTVGFSDDRDIREIQQVYETFKDIFSNELLPISAFVNIIGGEKPGEAHHDERETIFWQCIGTSEWTVYEDPAEGKYEVASLKIKNQFVLNPGDILYLKNRGIHSVKNYGPRAAIAFAPVK